MITLNELCAGMEASGRPLPPRTARDWWTKGLLPKPRRRGLGRGKGTETFWTERRVLQQARVAYDLLEEHSRADVALQSLWLLGFPVNLCSIRFIYLSQIGRHSHLFGDRTDRSSDDLVEDVVADLATKLARRLVSATPAPPKMREDLTDYVLPFLEAFYGLEEELVSGGLADLWKTAVVYLRGGIAGSRDLADFQPSDDDLATCAFYLKEMASLPAQREVMTSATDYELMRARRLMLWVFGWLGRIVRATLAEDEERVEALAPRLPIVFGRPAVPILVAVLRNNDIRRGVMASLLSGAKAIRTRSIQGTRYVPRC